MRNTIITLCFLIISVMSYGQSVSGPTAVTGGEEYEYTYNSNVAGQADVGTICPIKVKGGNSSPKDAYLAPGKKSVTFKVKWYNETATGVVAVAPINPSVEVLMYAELKDIKITKDNTCYTTTISGQNITSGKTYTGCSVEIINTTISNNANVLITGDKYVSIKSSFRAAKGTYVSIKNAGSTLKSTLALPSNIDIQGEDKSGLEQNYPNPFTGSSVISFFIPEKSKNAYLQIFDLGGGLVESISIQEKGNGQIVLDASKFKSNVIYLYSLYIDGVIIDTKKFYVK